MDAITMWKFKAWNNLSSWLGANKNQRGLFETGHRMPNKFMRTIVLAISELRKGKNGRFEPHMSSH